MTAAGAKSLAPIDTFAFNFVPHFRCDKKSRLFDPLAKMIMLCFHIRLGKLSDRRDCAGRPIILGRQLRLSRAGNIPEQHDTRTLFC